MGDVVLMRKKAASPLFRAICIVALAIGLGSLALPGAVNASNQGSDWRLVVAFHQVDVGAVSRVRRDYTLGWIRRDTNETDNRKKFSLLAFDKLDDDATMYTETTTTGSSRWVVIFEYTRDAPMWKGGPKPQTSLALRKGSDLTAIRDKWAKYAEDNEYRDYKIKLVLNMKSAKNWLNGSGNGANPYVGRPPMFRGPNPCTEDQESRECKDWREYNRAVGSIVG